MKSRTLTVMLSLLMTASVPMTGTVARSQSASPQAAGAVERKLEPGGGIRISNSFGSITITGWDRDTVRAQVSHDGAAEVVFTTTPAKVSVLNVAPGRSGKRIDLSVMLPRDAVIESASADKGDVSVSGIDGSVMIVSGGSISAEGIGGDLVGKATGNGGADVTRVRGLVDLAVVNGGVTIRDAGGDVRVASISGGVDVACVKGRVEVGNVNGPITLTNISGDVEATTSNSPVGFNGAIHPDRRYRLKSHNGSVEMRLPPDAPGFTATLSSYRGGMETDFPLVVQSPFSTRRFIGRYREGGDGRTSIQLDSFNGEVKLVKLDSVAQSDCRR